MNYKIVSDSSSNILRSDDPHFASVPMKVRAQQEYVDDAQLDVAGMVEDLRKFSGSSGSACPSVGEWVDAFGDAERVFVLTISKNLSGSYNSALQAAELYMEENPGREVHVVNTLTAGPEQAFLADKLLELCAQGLDSEAVLTRIAEYQDRTHTLFCLESMMNLARNGRVSMAVAKFAGLVGIRVCGEARNGQIVPVHKPRGAKKAIEALAKMIEERGFFDGARLRIAHCFAEAQAKALADAMRAKFPNLRLTLEPTTALCSYYAESGGLIIGFEGGFNGKNNSKTE